MKNFMGLIAVCFASNVFAQGESGPASPVKGANVVELVSIENMPVPLPPGEGDKTRKGGA